MTLEEIRNLYESNADFRQYIDLMCRTGRYTPEQCFSMELIRIIAEYYQGEKE